MTVFDTSKDSEMVKNSWTERERRHAGRSRSAESALLKPEERPRQEETCAVTCSGVGGASSVPKVCIKQMSRHGHTAKVVHLTKF